LRRNYGACLLAPVRPMANLTPSAGEFGEKTWKTG